MPIITQLPRSFTPYMTMMMYTGCTLSTCTIPGTVGPENISQNTSLSLSLNFCFSGNITRLSFSVLLSSGCSSQAIALSINGSTTVSNYIMCPPGVHESDIEHVSVLVCKSDQQIKRVLYSQHNWVEVRDCTAPNDCPFDPETGNPVTYAGLEGHANYPEENPLMVYMVVSGDAAGFVTLNNLGGVYIGDRAIADPFKKWVPTPDNVVYIPPPQEIYDQNMTEFEWALFGGNWGAPLQNPASTLTCISENQTYLYECPNDTAIQATQQALKLLKVLPIAASTEFVGNGEGYSIAAVSNSSVVGYPGIPGPLTRGYSYSWMGNRSSPIHQHNITTLTCPADIQLESTVPVTAVVDFNSSVSTISDYIIGIVVGGILLSLLLILVLILPILLDKSIKVQNMAVRQFSKTWRFAFGQSQQKKVKKNLEKEDKEEKEENAEKGVAVEEFVPPLGPHDAQTSASRGEILPDGASDMKAIPSAASTQVFEVEMQPVEHERMRNLVWLLFGVGLFVSGIVLASIGMDSLVNNSIVSAALDELHLGSTASTVLVILIVLLALVAAADILVIFIVVLMRRSSFRVWKWEFSNPLGNLPWCVRHSFELHVIAVGIVTLIITMSCLLFALAFGVTIVQLGARILCKKALSVQIFGRTAQDVCLTVPFITENQICGWQVLEFCGEVTNMEVRLLMLGAALLLWSHVIWLTSLTAALEGQRDHRVVWHPSHEENGNSK